jgi:hypothetical protein
MSDLIIQMQLNFFHQQMFVNKTLQRHLWNVEIDATLSRAGREQWTFSSQIKGQKSWTLCLFFFSWKGKKLSTTKSSHFTFSEDTISIILLLHEGSSVFCLFVADPWGQFHQAYLNIVLIWITSIRYLFLGYIWQHLKKNKTIALPLAKTGSILKPYHL